MSDEPLLDVRDLSISTPGDSQASLVQGVTFSIGQGEIVGIVGESGSGKTLTSLAVSGLLPSNLRMSASRLNFAGRDLLGTSDRSLETLLGTQMAMIFQDPMSSLNPARRIGKQMVESVRRHKGMSAKDAQLLAARSLESVRVGMPAKRLEQYPHELSGGMRQRVMIAMALMIEPALIIADEPTTALDVTVQSQVMSLIHQLNREVGSAVLLISHNISLMSEICDRIVVMFRGQIVEILSISELLAGPKHPYTRALVGAVPDLHTDRSVDLVTIDNLELERIDAELGHATH